MRPDAQLYRIELWRAIRASKGFHPNFPSWWTQRPIKVAGSPSAVTLNVPSLAEIHYIFEDFTLNYKKFESWHARQRHELLQAHLQHQQHRVFSLVKPEGKAQPSRLESSTEATVLAVSDDQCQLHVFVDLPSPLAHRFTVAGEGDLPVTHIEGQVWTLAHPTSVEVEDAIDITRRYVTPNDLHEALRAYWTPKWWQDQPPNLADWDRICQFAMSHIPSRTGQYSPIDHALWTLSRTTRKLPLVDQMGSHTLTFAGCRQPSSIHWWNCGTHLCLGALLSISIGNAYRIRVASPQARFFCSGSRLSSSDHLQHSAPCLELHTSQAILVFGA